MKVYLAGALFNEAEVNQRKQEGRMFRARFQNVEFFNPIDQPFNENKQSLPTSIEIFEADANAVRAADIIIADITNEDAGVMVEIGQAIELGKVVIGINSDIRLKSANKYDIPTYGMNHYLLGALEKHGYLVYSFEEAFEIIEKILEG